jgi:hypothetical protein
MGRKSSLGIGEVEVQTWMTGGDQVMVHVAERILALRVRRRADVTARTDERPFSAVMEPGHPERIVSCRALRGGPGGVLVHPATRVPVAGFTLAAQCPGEKDSGITLLHVEIEAAAGV